MNYILDELKKLFGTDFQAETEFAIHDECFTDLFIPQVGSVWRVKPGGTSKFAPAFKRLEEGRVLAVVETQVHSGGYVRVTAFLDGKMVQEYYCGDDWNLAFEAAT